MALYFLSMQIEFLIAATARSTPFDQVLSCK